MANICDTTYKIVGKKEEVQSIFDVLQAVKQQSPNVGGIWLGRVVEHLGGDLQTIACRGDIISFDLSDEVLTIIQSTKWNEQAGFRHFLETKYPHIKIFYREEECGCDVYYTNDHTGHYFPEMYLLDNYNEPEYFKTLNEAIKRVEEITGIRFISTEDDMLNALDLYMERHEDEDIFYSMHKFTVVDD